MEVKPIADIRSAVEPIATEMGIEIVDIEFRQGREPALTIFADTATGIDLDTCEAFHRAIDPVLDELDPTFGKPYTLNVSSPGLDRPLKTERDFQRVLGQKLELKLYAPMKGKKYFEGVLKAFDENTVTIAIPEKGVETDVKFVLNQIAKINKAIDFD